jgi:hypothetical protein
MGVLSQHLHLAHPCIITHFLLHATVWGSIVYQTSMHVAILILAVISYQTQFFLMSLQFTELVLATQATCIIRVVCTQGKVPCLSHDGHYYVHLSRTYMHIILGCACYQYLFFIPKMCNPQQCMHGYRRLCMAIASYALLCTNGVGVSTDVGANGLSADANM